MRSFLFTGASDGRTDRADPSDNRSRAHLSGRKETVPATSTRFFLCVLSRRPAALAWQVLGGQAGSWLGTRQSRFNYIPPIHFGMKNIWSNTRLPPRRLDQLTALLTLGINASSGPKRKFTQSITSRTVPQRDNRCLSVK